MKTIFILIWCIGIFPNIYSQREINSLFREYNSSLSVNNPYDKNSSCIYFPKDIYSSLEKNILTLTYGFAPNKKDNPITWQDLIIDLSQTRIYNGYYSTRFGKTEHLGDKTIITMESANGIKINITSYQTHNSIAESLLIDSWKIQCQSEALANKLVSQFQELQRPYLQTPLENVFSEKTDDQYLNKNNKQLKGNTKKQQTEQTKLRIFTNKYFSIQYPNTWELIHTDKKVTNKTYISAQFMQKVINEYDFRPNINIIVSSIKRRENTSLMADITIAQNKQILPSYRFISKQNNVKLGNLNGTKVVSEWLTNGYKIHSIQYIVKRADNTTFIITISLDAKKHNSQIENTNKIIQTFNSKL